MTNLTASTVTVSSVGWEWQAVAYEPDLANFVEGVAHDAQLDNRFLVHNNQTVNVLDVCIVPE